MLSSEPAMRRALLVRLLSPRRSGDRRPSSPGESVPGVFVEGDSSRGSAGAGGGASAFISCGGCAIAGSARAMVQFGTREVEALGRDTGVCGD
jgi:hypothetical protein